MLAKWTSRRSAQRKEDVSQEPKPRPSTDDIQPQKKRAKAALGILNDKHTDEVPGSVLLLSKVYNHNEPLGLQHAPARHSSSSLPSPYLRSRASSLSRTRASSRKRTEPEKKRTPDGKIILDPQPEDSPNDPLNWPTWRRDAALFSLGFYCMLGGGMTPILAAGFDNVADTYNVTVPKVALTTGLYMMGLGVGCVIASPTAILFGKRPVYLTAAIAFILSSVWCALSPSYNSLLVARIVQGIAVSPVECLPSATVAEIFFLHERAYRLGIYTLLLLGGKNLVPLVSAVIVNSLGWRWVFWVVAMIVGFCFCLLFLFVPETFWDRTPRPHHFLHSRRPSHTSDKIYSGPHFGRATSSITAAHTPKPTEKTNLSEKAAFPFPTPNPTPGANPQIKGSLAQRRLNKLTHVNFAPDNANSKQNSAPEVSEGSAGSAAAQSLKPNNAGMTIALTPGAQHDEAWRVEPQGGAPETPFLHNLNSPFYENKAAADEDYFSLPPTPAATAFPPAVVVEPAEAIVEEPPQQDGPSTSRPHSEAITPLTASHTPASYRSSRIETRSGTSTDVERVGPLDSVASELAEAEFIYTEHYRQAPPKSFVHSMKPYSGRLSKDNWFRAALRPFILYAYPSVLWSSVVYSLSIGWLIVLSESVSHIYKNRESYNFTSLQVGLVYLSPFIGGILGTAVAGKVSDVIVRFMSRRNDGIYEPEFRLVMAIPIAICTTIGLMGFGWSAQERDLWIVPTIFFGVISFGCSLGSTTAITFCVDSYRQYAGEALVTLNFSKNIFHGLVFSLFFNNWLDSSGPKKVFISIGGIQLACLIFTIPMYIYGKRARMWTVRKNLIEQM